MPLNQPFVALGKPSLEGKILNRLLDTMCTITQFYDSAGETFYINSP